MDALCLTIFTGRRRRRPKSHCEDEVSKFTLVAIDANLRFCPALKVCVNENLCIHEIQSNEKRKATAIIL